MKHMKCQDLYEFYSLTSHSFSRQVTLNDGQGMEILHEHSTGPMIFLTIFLANSIYCRTREKKYCVNAISIVLTFIYFLIKKILSTLSSLTYKKEILKKVF